MQMLAEPFVAESVFLYVMRHTKAQLCFFWCWGEVF